MHEGISVNLEKQFTCNSNIVWRKVVAINMEVTNYHCHLSRGGETTIDMSLEFDSYLRSWRCCWLFC